MSEWIRAPREVEQRLPAIGIKVLLAVEWISGGVIQYELGTLHKSGWSINRLGPLPMFGRVIYWMPIPELPKSKEEEA